MNALNFLVSALVRVLWLKVDPRGKKISLFVLIL